MRKFYNAPRTISSTISDRNNDQVYKKKIPICNKTVIIATTKQWLVVVSGRSSNFCPFRLHVPFSASGKRSAAFTACEEFSRRVRGRERIAVRSTGETRTTCARRKRVGREKRVREIVIGQVCKRRVGEHNTHVRSCRTGDWRPRRHGDRGQTGPRRRHLPPVSAARRFAFNRAAKRKGIYSCTQLYRFDVFSSRGLRTVNRGLISCKLRRDALTAVKKVKRAKSYIRRQNRTAILLCSTAVQTYSHANNVHRGSRSFSINGKIYIVSRINIIMKSIFERSSLTTDYPSHRLQRFI